jgi:hypothetical protein
LAEASPALLAGTAQAKKILKRLGRVRSENFVKHFVFVRRSARKRLFFFEKLKLLKPITAFWILFTCLHVFTAKIKGIRSIMCSFEW